MAKLLVAFLFTVALVFGLSTGSSSTYACPDKAAKAADTASTIQLAADDGDDDDGDDDDGDDDDGDDDKG